MCDATDEQIVCFFEFAKDILERNKITERIVKRYIYAKLNCNDVLDNEKYQIKNDYESIISYAKDRDEMKKNLEILDTNNFPDDCPEYAL